MKNRIHHCCCDRCVRQKGQSALTNPTPRQARRFKSDRTDEWPGRHRGTAETDCLLSSVELCAPTWWLCVGWLCVCVFYGLC
eukprot:scaffold114645_cov34-Prasinocladus_malaysianus.AAC.1